ncbi:NlpC/P60 family protein [Kutzneria viridogrisea]|uniref:NlpC/P60 domain-containing protein n=1 Tax=Kutzneria viridogrisea TaxID=47990 RepID=A0ABR6BJ44_9PSEU|nr:hypothetical protein [Kutzneria viridogrisea]
MIAKVGVAALAVIILIPLVIAAGVSGAISAVFGGGSQPSQSALADIPADYLALYRAAAGVCPGLDWTVLAAIGKIETDHGRSTLPGVHNGQNEAGAGGPMQFLRDTFDGVVARHPLPAGGASPPSRYDPHDAIYAAAYYLCDNGAGRGDLHSAIFAYNHAEWYVQEVLDQAKKYSQQTLNVSAACGTFQQTVQQRAEDFSEGRAMVAVQFACAQLGKPYVWGGNGDPGFDCSGLTKAAYGAAGITLPRVAQDQFNAGPLVSGQPLLPGDLVFFGASASAITHVGIAVSPTEMINAPDVGFPVQVDKISGHLVGVTRPAGRI